MPVKSIISIDVDDAKFTRFRELFGKYTEELGKTPNSWKAVGKESAAMATQFERMAAALMAQNALTQETKDAEEKRHKQLSANERLWTSMAKSSRVIAKNALNIGTTLFKWSAILGGGLLGGSLWGIDKMARDVANSRRSAMGLGLSMGEQRSFGINFERLLDPNFLSQVAEMKADPTKAGPLYTLGVGTGGSTEQTATALVDAMRKKALATPANMRGLLDSMTGMNVGFETWNRLGTMDEKEYQSLRTGNKSGIGAFGIDPVTALKWQNFTTQMEKAGATIFKVFVEGLEPLATPLENLSKSIVKFVGALAKSDLAENAIKGIGEWLDSFSGKIAKPEFLTKVEQFTQDLGVLSDTVHDAIQDPVGTAENLGAKAVSSSFKAGPLGFLAGGTGFGSWLTSLWDPQKGKANWLGLLDAKYKLPHGSLDYLWQHESSRGTDPKALAAGEFQLTGDAAKGIDRHDFSQSAERAARIIADELQRYGGDIAKAIAAYNIGEGGVDRAVKQYGANWQQHVQYVSSLKVGPQGVSVTVNNNTGGSAHVAVNQLAGAMSVSAAMIAFKLQSQLSPVILTAGLATAQGGAIPISNLVSPSLLGITATVNRVTGQPQGGTNPQQDGTGADFVPMAGGTVISNQAAQYPFANQAVAANAIIAQPLNISMSMLIPVTGNLTYPARQSLFMALVSTLKQHIGMGGLFSVITPAFIYTNCILLMLRDVSGGEVNQAQYRWQWDFFQPLVTQQQANQAQNGLMQTITNGTPIVGTPSWSTGLPVNNPTTVQGLTPPPGFS